MAFDVRPIREAEREECIALWTTVWPCDSDAYFRKYFFGDIEWLPYYTQVGVLDGRLVSAAHVCKRIVGCGDGRLTMGGLANVVSLPEYRGMGYNTECLRRLIAVMEADAMDFSLLGTGINAYYERLAYETLPLPWISGPLRASVPASFVAAEHGSFHIQNRAVRRQPTSVPAGLSPFRVRRAIASDALRIQEIYRAYNRSRPLTVERSAAYWRDWIGISEADAPTDTLVAVDTSDRVQGYVRTGVFLSAVPYSEDAIAPRVTELGVSDDADTLLCTAALLDAIAVFAVMARARELRLAVALESSVVAVAERLVTEVRQQVDSSMMVRLLHADNLFRSMTPAWNERWIAAGRPPGHIAFMTPYGAVTLDANGRFLRVVPAADGREGLSQAVFFGLLFGLLAPELVRADSSQILLLQALFPPRAAVYYGADGF